MMKKLALTWCIKNTSGTVHKAIVLSKIKIIPQNKQIPKISKTKSTFSSKYIINITKYMEQFWQAQILVTLKKLGFIIWKSNMRTVLILNWKFNLCHNEVLYWLIYFTDPFFKNFIATALSTKNCTSLKIYNFCPIITKLCQNKVLKSTLSWQSFVMIG